MSQPKSGDVKLGEPKDKAPVPPRDEAQRLLEQAAGRARLALLWERAWPLLVAVLVVLAAFLVVSWAGLWLVLPPVGRLIGVVAFLGLLAAALWPFRRFVMPSKAEALARLDRDTALPHRPATAIADRLATKPEDAVGAALWRAHRTRVLEAARALKVDLPRPNVAARDPRALRALALLALVPTFFLASGERLQRIAAAFHWSGPVAPVAYRLDAWIDPPGYTGRPPVVLPGLKPDDGTLAHAASVTVPSGSVLVVRAVGVDAATLQVEGGLAEQSEAPAEGAAPAGRPPAGAQERRFVITDHGTASLTGPDLRSVRWDFEAVKDHRPTIAFAKDPETGPRNALVLSYRMEDDYGVKEATAAFAPLPPEPPFFPRPGAKAEAVPAKPLVPAPDFALALPPGGKGAARTSKDLMAHPWAGANVQLTLKAKDEAGNTAESETKAFRLPARAFTKPLARALIDERRRLAFDARNRMRLARVLTALMIQPQDFTPSAGEYLGLSTALARVSNARNDDDLRDVVNYLWEIAVLIEDGTLTEAERELKAAQEALREALDKGASDEEIRRLTDNLRAAMEKMMRQLAEQAQRNQSADQSPIDPNTRIMRPQDLRRMLDRIEDLARSGSRDAARQLLDEMQAMMENLRPGNRQAGQQGGQQQQSELGNLIQEQQRLRDRTFQQGRQGQQGQRGQQGQQGQRGQGQQGQQGQRGQGQQGQNGGDFSQLQQGQEALRERLGRMLDQLQQMQRNQGQNGQPGEQGEGQGEAGDALGRAGEAFGRAEQAMRDAERALGQGDGQGALDAEGRALQALRQGAQSLAEGQQGNPNGMGPGGPSSESAERTDPLGRPLRSQDYGDDFSVKVPDEVDAQRARRVLEELRRRFEQMDRPQIELDYLERLLRGL